MKKSVIAIEGETPLTTNFHSSFYRIPENKKFFGGKSLELDASQRLEEAYFAKYPFSVPETGEYQVIIAGTPPGPLKKGSPWHSPYFIHFDNEAPKLLSEEVIAEAWPLLFQHAYAQGGYYFTNLGSYKLSAGNHTLTVTVSQGRPHDQAYVLYVDAIFLAPKEFRPVVNPGKIPKDVFNV